MGEPVWVRRDSVLAVHQLQLAEHGGEDGIHDLGLLDSALARPKNLLAYLEEPPDLPRLAASYAYGLIQDHPFRDGNKRVAWVVCRTFLKLNGRDMAAPPEEKYLTVLRLAAGDISEEDFAAWLRDHLT